MQAATTPNQATATNGGKIAKPVRREFYNTLVIRNNGAVVPEAEWKKVATGNTPREVRKQLKTAGMQAVRVFDKEAYEGSRKSFKDDMKNSAKAERESVITDSFKEADVEVNTRIAAALKTLLPLFRDVPSKKTVTAFRNIIRSVTGSVDLNAPAVKAAGKTDDSDADNKADQAGVALH